MNPGQPDHETVLVRGDSMLPTLADGDVVRLLRERAPRLGDLVVARHPFRTDVLLVKRVTAHGPDGFELHGDNPRSSTDSRTLGPFPAHRILGVALVPADRGDR